MIVDDNQEKALQIYIAKRLFSKMKKRESSEQVFQSCPRQKHSIYWTSCTRKDIALLNLQKGGKKKIEEVLVFHRQDEIANHYGVGKQAISNLANSSE